MLIFDIFSLTGLPQSQNQNWLSQGNPFQTLDPHLALPSPSVIIARKKRSSISCKIHESMCKYWCRVAGHSSGTCDIEVVLDYFRNTPCKTKKIPDYL